MSELSTIRQWLEEVKTEVKSGHVVLHCTEQDPLSVTMTMTSSASNNLLSLTRQCLGIGALEKSAIDIDPKSGLIAWKVVTPESFQRFSGGYGDTMSFSAMRTIHESPDSVHAKNSAYLIGR